MQKWCEWWTLSLLCLVDPIYSPHHIWFWLLVFQKRGVHTRITPLALGILHLNVNWMGGGECSGKREGFWTQFQPLFLLYIPRLIPSAENHSWGWAPPLTQNKPYPGGLFYSDALLPVQKVRVSLTLDDVEGHPWNSDSCEIWIIEVQIMGDFILSTHLFSVKLTFSPILRLKNK